MANKNKNELTFAVSGDASGFRKFANEVDGITRKLTSSLSKELANLGKVQVPNFKPISSIRDAIRESDLKYSLGYLYEKRDKLVQSKSFTRTGRPVFRTPEQLAKIDEKIRKTNEDIALAMAKSALSSGKFDRVESSRTYEDGKKKIEESRDIAYAYKDRFAETESGEVIPLLERERNIIKNITDARTGEIKQIQTVVRSQQVLTAKGLEWQDVANDTYEIILEEGKKVDKRFKTFWKKLFDRVKSVAIYRLIRGALKSIVNSGTQGLNNLATADREFNKTLGTLQSSLTSLNNSFASLLRPIIEILQPVLTFITDKLAGLVNTINEAKAAMSGQTEYTQILTSDMKEYKKQIDAVNGSLLKFDSFNILSSSYTGVKKSIVGISPEEADVVIEKLKGIKFALIAISAVVATLIMANPIGLIIGAAALVAVFWDDIINGLKMAVSAIGLFFLYVAKGIAWVLDTLFIRLNPLVHIANLFGAGIPMNLLEGNIDYAISETKGWGGFYATGGTFSSGDFFVANENGTTEMIASNNNGGGNVMNLQQWEQVAYNSYIRALQNYNAAKNNNVNMNDIGRAIAGNSGFVNEINRRNATVNLV